jgi:DNA topoisomerase-2
MDDAILQYQEEDGKLVEPRHFLPVIPLVLVNGSSGIGTGWSTTIPSFHPLDLIQYIRDRLEGKQSATALVPWVRGFKGSIEHNDSKFQTHGVVKRSSDTVVEVRTKCIVFYIIFYQWINHLAL